MRGDGDNLRELIVWVSSVSRARSWTILDRFRSGGGGKGLGSRS